MKNNVLHICNYAEVSNIPFYTKLVTVNDSVVIYCDFLNKNQCDELLVLFRGICKNIYFVIDKNQDKLQTIDHRQWVELLNNSRTSFTWR